jgi:hypothetical protein
MGLDMYLHGRNSIGYDDKKLAYKVAEFFPELKEGVLAVLVEAAYWRKANAIHNWFVKNVQRGDDDCGEYSVERSQLQTLINLCKEVLNNKEKALELLPPTNGFFFGSNETDDWYWESLENTIGQLETCLSWPKNWDFTYHSSW